MSKGHSLQDPYLNALRKQRIPVSVYLVSGIKLQGQIESFDQFVILLRNTVSQMVYKHAISTVVPSRAVKLPMPGSPTAARGAQGGNYARPGGGNVSGNVQGNRAPPPAGVAGDDYDESVGPGNA